MGNREQGTKKFAPGIHSAFKDDGDSRRPARVEPRTTTQPEVHMVVSPHLDDGILSCGGAVAGLASLGLKPMIVTIFAGDPLDKQRSTYANALEQRWGLAEQCVEARREEDRAACKVVGAAPVHLGFLDAVYRRTVAGGWRSESRSDLFSGAQQEDVALLPQIASALSDLCRAGSILNLWAPLGMGNHVDHIIARLAAEQVHRSPRFQGRTRLHLYEDMPYAANLGASAVEAIARRNGHRGIRHQCSEISWRSKLQAIREYVSQQPTLWSGDRGIAILNDYAMQSLDGLAERFWYEDSPVNVDE